MTRARVALLVAVLAAATVAGAWAFQLAGYQPCELCYKERIPYYVGALVAVVAFLFARTGRPATSRITLGIAGLVFAAGTLLGGYHAGVEFGWWPGPSDCTGDFTAAVSTQDFLKQLESVQVVRCDAVAIRVLGLSLAAWNAVLSAVLTAMSFAGVARRG